MRFLLKKPKTASRNTDDSVSNQLPPPYRSSPVSKPHPRYEFPPNFFAEAGLEGGENDLEILRDYDTVIIVDDSGSMGEHRCHSWNQVSDTFSPLLTEPIPDSRLLLQAREAVAELAVIASMYDEDGIEIYFLNQVDTRKEEINPSRKFTVRLNNFRVDNSPLTCLHLSVQKSSAGPLRVHSIWWYRYWKMLDKGR